MAIQSNENSTDINKVALKAGSWYVFSSVMLRAISMLTTPIFARLMTTDDFGVASTFSSWASIFIVFCTLNLTFSIGRAKIDYPGKLDEYIGSMQLLSVMLSGIVAFFLLVFLGKVSSYMAIPKLAVVFLVFQLVSSPAIDFYQNGTRYRYRYKENVFIGWYLCISNIILSLLLILLVDYDKGVLRIVGGVIPTFILGIFLLGKSIKSGYLKYNKEYWKYGVTLSTPLVLHEISHSILSQSDRIFITRICGSSDTGIYSIAYSYGCLMAVVTSAISNGWLPWFHDKYFEKSFDEIRKNTKTVVVLGCYIGLACIALAPEAVAIMGGTQYTRGVVCIAPVTLGIVCQYIYTHYVNIEMHLKKTKFVPVGALIAALLNLILNAIFIPKYGFVAAAYTTFVSYFVLMLIHYVYSRWVLKVSLYDDFFMFGALIITLFISRILIWSYAYTGIRISFLLVGFMSFLYYFRKYIIAWIRNRTH